MHFGISNEDAIAAYKKIDGRDILRVYTFEGEILSDYRTAGTIDMLKQDSTFDALGKLWKGSLLNSDGEFNSIEMTFVTNDLGLQCWDFIKNGYVWNISTKCPNIAATIGFYVLFMDSVHNYDFDRRRDAYKAFLRHYSQNKDDVDVYIAQAILSS